MNKKINVILIIIICMFVTSGCSNDENIITYTSITIEQMEELYDEGVIIDVRTNSEYESYNIDGSINIPLDEITSIEQIVTDKSTQIFVYCASGARSNEAAETLINLGYTNVYDMGGLYS